ncbi:hypothetical protein HOP50_15g74290 [Chloropicon primus]|uniref:Uncharacterized protein n=1 Tax=Chloropicon primus TaxID=1764295 RepID=A0A5B8MXM8_9CHLO|nr:hypothetical protein A3770_15p74040 [Chloropicon primus]UPR04096.1 hypothetical protein HOP50_15g74290 [Chloropicon primus]|eukprot:QDZ24886.1 hypothetical protein A3770_15p74040 [Chloropicon primus]
MQGKEFTNTKSPEIIGRDTPPASPQKTPPVPVERKKNKEPSIPTYVHIKKRLKEALREIDRLKGEKGLIFDKGMSLDKFVTPNSKKILLSTTPEAASRRSPPPVSAPAVSTPTPVAPAKTASAAGPSSREGKAPLSLDAKIAQQQQQKSEITPAKSEITPAKSESTPAKSESIDRDSDVNASDVFQQMLQETMLAFLKSGMTFNKVGRNGKVYQRIVRWSSDMKSVEWVKAFGESPRYVLMNSLNNAAVSIKEEDSMHEICTLTSDHRTLQLVLETSSQRHWADLTMQVVKNRSSVSQYLESISKQL